MSRYSLVIFLILFETLLNTCSVSGEESHAPFISQMNKKSGLENVEISKNKEFNYETNAAPSDEKIIEKRRLYFGEDDPNSPANNDRQSENTDYLERRRNNYSEPENDPKSPEFQYRPNNNWDNERGRFSLLGQGGNIRNPEDNRQLFVAQSNPNQRHDWDKGGDPFGSQPRWNEERKFKQFDNNSPNLRMGNSYNGRPPAMFNDNEMNGYSDERNQDYFNRRISITTLNEREMGPGKNYNGKTGGDVDSGYVEQSRNYYNRNPTSFWSSNFNTPEKGVIINFNTECSKPGQYSGNQLIHKFIYTPKTSLQSLQGSDLISSPRMYYL